MKLDFFWICSNAMNKFWCFFQWFTGVYDSILRQLKAQGLLYLSRNQPTGLCFHLFAIIQTYTFK